MTGKIFPARSWNGIHSVGEKAWSLFRGTRRHTRVDSCNGPGTSPPTCPCRPSPPAPLPFVPQGRGEPDLCRYQSSAGGSGQTTANCQLPTVNFPRPRRQRGGFTILEVILTLALAVVLMSLVGGTLQFYAHNLNVRDMDVRRVHLAASIMQMITDDLRAATHPPEFDSSTLEQFLTGAAGQAVSQSLGAEASAALGLDDMTSTLGSSTTAQSEPENLDLMTSTMSLQRPGIIGSQTELQFDISRLPRWEQWQQTLPDEPNSLEVQDIPSDMKTVTYYIQPPGATGGVPDPLRGFLPNGAGDGDQVPGGLVRRELDRAANKWAMEKGGMSGLLATGDLIASEVLAIEFSYFDGNLWQPYWNSDQQQALPLAVEVKITIGDTAATVPEDAEEAAGSAGEPRVFTQVIQLPAGRMVDTTQTTMGAL